MINILTYKQVLQLIYPCSRRQIYDYGNYTNQAQISSDEMY